MLRRLAVVCLVLVLPGCGGGVTPPPPPPTPTPVPVTFTGSYTGPMCITGAGVACLSVTGRTTVTQSGNNVTFDSLVISGAVNGTFGGAQAVLTSGNNFNAVGSYQAQCGIVNTSYVGFFSGDGRLVNLRVVLSGCADLQFIGELSK